MDDRSEARIPSSEQERRERLLTVLRLALVGLVLAAGLAVAAPGARVAEQVALAACSAPPVGQSVIVLPPGHPPIADLELQGRAVTGLPPGHPPVGGLGARPIPARPLAPIFLPPETVDL
jgi:hypothetical protein